MLSLCLWGLPGITRFRETCDPNWAKSIGFVTYPMFLHSMTSGLVSVRSARAFLGVIVQVSCSTAAVLVLVCLLSLHWKCLRCVTICRLSPRDRPPERHIETWATAFQPLWASAADYSIHVWPRTASCWRPSQLGLKKLQFWVYFFFRNRLVEEGLFKFKSYSGRVLQDTPSAHWLSTGEQDIRVELQNIQ